MALAFGITWCATHWPKVEAEWNKIFNKTPQDQPEEPTPEDPDGPYVHVHEYGEWKITFSPTCVEAGTETRTCACGYFEEREIAALGHTFGEWQMTTSPTCTTDGVKTKTCANCTESQTETLPATGHNFGEWKTTTAPTCTTDGVKTKTCANCTESQTETLPATGHTFGEWTITTAPTCTESGTETRTCACGYSEEREIAATGHTYGEWQTTTAPTCTTDGVKTKTCANCIESQTETLPATGHSLGDWTITKAATCTESGTETRTCACGYSEEREIAATGHTYGEWETTTEATCASAGSMKRTCETCSVVETKSITKLAHTYEQDGSGVKIYHLRFSKVNALSKKIYFDDGTTQTIMAKYTCTDCGLNVICPHRHMNLKHCMSCDKWEILRSEKHVWETSLTQITKQPTCLETGTRTKTCHYCGYVLTEEIPALGHNFGDWETTTEATCTTDGVRTKTCASCGESQTETLEALGHNYVNGTCSRCGENDPDYDVTVDNVQIAIEQNVLKISDNHKAGTINLYYRESGTENWCEYVVGNEESFDLTILLSRDYQPMEVGKTYEIYIMRDTNDKKQYTSNIVVYTLQI